jgi:predicted nucleotidyltransferase
MSAQAGKKSSLVKTTKKLGETRTNYRVRNKRAATSSRDAIIKKCKDTLAQFYGKQLRGVILYGSTARGQSNPGSDIDLLVLLAPPLDYFAELRQIVDVLYPIQLESKQLISAKPVSFKDFERGSISLYRNAKLDGVAV